MRTFTLLLLAITLFTTNLCFSQSGKRIKINNYTQTTINQMIAAGIDLRCGAIFEEDYIQIELSEQDLDMLDNTNITYDVLISDLTTFYQEQTNEDLPLAIQQLEMAKAQSVAQRGSVASSSINNFLQYQGCDEMEWPVPLNFNLGSMGGCLTYTEAYQEMDDMKTLFPNLISARTDASPSGTGQTTWGNTLGTATWPGQSIYYVRITGDEGTTPEGTRPQMLFTSMTHSREVSSLMGNIYFMWYLLENYSTDPAVKNLVDNNELYFIPIVNPDGLRWNETIAPSGGGLQRKNLRPNAGDTGTVDINNNVRGVDINRNFDYFWGTAGIGSSGTTTS
ncbi:MAG: hypothetical protein HKP28_07755, partial [Winogradskyella sp.]|nr:hypothetical protein [Winogradskyella sp.]